MLLKNAFHYPSNLIKTFLIVDAILHNDLRLFSNIVITGP